MQPINITIYQGSTEENMVFRVGRFQGAVRVQVGSEWEFAASDERTIDLDNKAALELASAILQATTLP